MSKFFYIFLSNKLPNISKYDVHFMMMMMMMMMIMMMMMMMMTTMTVMMMIVIMIEDEFLSVLSILILGLLFTF